MTKFRCCEICKHNNKCKIMETFYPYGCSAGFEIAEEIESYELEVLVTVKVMADSIDNAFIQCKEDEYRNTNPCVEICDCKIVKGIINE